MNDVEPQLPPTGTDAIRRTTAPETANGSRWEVQLSAVPSREWLEVFKGAEEGPAPATAAPTPRRVVFDRASANFKSDEDHVERWIAAIDRWLAWTNERYGLSLDEASRERASRAAAEAKQRERIRQMNDRFKGL